jgi:uncharacterized SAM-binding protein YcdF (DUF218 family)
MYEFTKSLSLLAYPLGGFLLLALAGWIQLARSRRRSGHFFLGLGLSLLWILSMPAVADRLMAGLERDWPQVPVEQLPLADAILILGGAFSTGNGQFLYPSAGGQASRYWHGARLYRAKRAPLVIVSGGREPHRTGGMTEAEAGAMFLQDMGVPTDAIVLDTEALTTHGHVASLQPILQREGVHTVLVVTSASHMGRAMASLSALDARLVPVATDYSTFEEPAFRLRRLLPNVGSLSRSTRALHERIGLLYYRVRGWA